MRKRECTWFLEPLDAHTNQAIAREVGEENAQIGLKATDGKEHDVWQCPYSVVGRCLKSRKTAKLKFKVFNRTTSHSPLRPWLFGNKSRRQKQSNTQTTPKR